MKVGRRDNELTAARLRVPAMVLMPIFMGFL
jgi:hypothetical protein